MEEERDNEDSFYMGIICGLFSILGLYAGLLYEKQERKEFIRGWRMSFFISIAIVIIVVVIRFAILNKH